jgi:hypothetical protein
VVGLCIKVKLCAGERSEPQEHIRTVDFEAALEGRTAGSEEGIGAGRGWRVARDLEAVISRFALDEVRATFSPSRRPCPGAAPRRWPSCVLASDAAYLQPAGSPIVVPAWRSTVR